MRRIAAVMEESERTMRGLVITGIDTGVGKTYVTAGILRALAERGIRAGAYKPVCSGAEKDPKTGEVTWADLEILSAACPVDAPLDLICPQRFLAPLAPPAAAAREDRKVDDSLLTDGARKWSGSCDLLLVEGIGGWLCPLSDRMMFAGLAGELGFPVLIVAANRLGMLNHSLLTAEAVLRVGLPLAGILVNDISADRDESADSNLQMLTRFASCPVLGRVPFASGTPTHSEFFASLDWEALSRSGS